MKSNTTESNTQEDAGSGNPGSGTSPHEPLTRDERFARFLEEKGGRGKITSREIAEWITREDHSRKE